MAYKQKNSPFLNSYTNPEKTTVPVVDTKVDMDFSNLPKSKSEKESPLNNAYSNPNTQGYYQAVDSSIDLDYAGLSANGVTSGSSTSVPTKADDLVNEGKKDYPHLQHKMKNAKNANKRQKIAGKINKRQIKDAGKATKKDLRQNVKEADLQKKQADKIEKTYKRQSKKMVRKGIDAGTANPYDPVKQKDKHDAFEKLDPAVKKQQVVLGSKDERTDPFKKSPYYMKTPLNYLNPNTLEVQGDAGQSQDPSQQMPEPNRAGRPINSNVLMNDPTNYQDPSKVSAQQNNQAQMFSGLASSAGTPNPEPMIPGQDPNQSITPGQQSPFNQNGGPGDPPKREKKIEGVKKKPSYRLMQSISGTDTTSYEMVPGKTTMEQWGTKADGTPNMIPTTTSTKREISNEEYRRRMKGSPAKKKNWIQDVNKDIERRGTKGVCTGDKFGGPTCPPGSKRYNLAKTFRKMNKK